MVVGDKNYVCEIVCEVNVFMVLGSFGFVENIVIVFVVVEQFGYLVMLKVVVGGGGKGMCQVVEFDEMESVFCIIVSEVILFFVDGCVYIEKLIF